MPDIDKEDPSHKKSLAFAVCKGILVSALATIGISALAGKSKTFLKKENLKDTAIEFASCLTIFGGLIVTKTAENNNKIDELTKQQATTVSSFTKRYEQEKLQSSKILPDRG
jgi:hypothetical protein